MTTVACARPPRPPRRYRQHPADVPASELLLGIAAGHRNVAAAGSRAHRCWVTHAHDKTPSAVPGRALQLAAIPAAPLAVAADGGWPRCPTAQVRDHEGTRSSQLGRRVERWNPSRRSPVT